MDKLEKTFGLLQQCVTAQDREKVSEMQGYICGAIQSLIPRLGLQVIAPCSDKLMMLLLQVFQSQPNSVHDGALLVVGTFAAVVDEHFEKYMQHFQPVLLAALKNAQDHQVCTIAVNVVGDLCRSLGTKILPYCDEIVQQLLENLRDPYLNRDVKPPILSAFGDVGLAVGPYFEKYMPLVMAMLIQAAGTQVNSDDYEMVEYLNSLREGIFEAFTGILQGLKDDKNNKTELFAPYVNEVLGFIQVVAADKERFDSVTRTAVGCIGDMAHALGPQQARQLNICQPFCQSLIMECEQSDNQSLKDVGYWAKKILSQ
jgi:importin subunit beta-1